ncbi:MAG TPA: DUF2255 family protein [Pyrinomonadaceae bacterium]
MKAKRGFAKNVVAAIRDGKILGIRAGTKPHRVIGIWAVVVENRVFVRSWSMKPRSWYRTFLEEPHGVIEVDGREIPVRAVFTRSERLKDKVDRAYREKYNTPGSLYFVRGFAHKKRRDTTTELVPGKTVGSRQKAVRSRQKAVRSRQTAVGRKKESSKR